MSHEPAGGQSGFGRRHLPDVRHREGVAAGMASAAPAATRPGSSEAEDPLGAIKIRVFGLILETIDVATIDKLGHDRARTEITALVAEIVAERGIEVSAPEQDRITRDILNDMFGLGPIEPLMDDPDITDIMVNGPRKVFIERKGRIELTGIHFRDNAQLVNICMRIAGGVNRRAQHGELRLRSDSIRGTGYKCAKSRLLSGWIGFRDGALRGN